MRKVVVADACRTPIGTVPGSLIKYAGTELISRCFAQLARRVPINWKDVPAAYVGSSFPQEKDNLARKAVAASGLPSSISASTINKTCASSMEALFQGISRIMAFDASAVLVGGVESMSNSAYSLRFFKQRVKAMMNGELPTLAEAGQNPDENEMPVISEIVAAKYGITREEQDLYAYESRERAINASKAGLFDAEILSLPNSQSGGSSAVSHDDAVSKPLDRNAYQNEASFFIRNGCVTRFNSAPIGDAAAAILLMSGEYAKSNRISPIAEIAGIADIGLEKGSFGLGATEAAKSVMRTHAFRESDIDLFECNESFAAEAILFMKMLGVSRNKLNKNGGSIGLGYPVGCEGLRLCVTQLHTMRREHVRVALSAISAGALMGQAVIFKNLDNA